MGYACRSFPVRALLGLAASVLVVTSTGLGGNEQQQALRSSQQQRTAADVSAPDRPAAASTRADEVGVGARRQAGSRAGLTKAAGKGPYALREVRNVQVRSHDGVLLDGWIASPTVPAGVRTPTVLMVSPYFDMLFASAVLVGRNPSSDADPTCEPQLHQGCGYWYDGPMSAPTRINSLGLPPIHLIQRGYTLAYFSVRGTGSSGGCLEWGGRNEQRDQVALVNWLAGQSWSNGRVGMGGLSYLAYTTWQAAVQAPPALKATVTAGDLRNLYENFHSPQGSLGPGVTGLTADYDAELGLSGGALSRRPQFLEHVTCPHLGLTEQAAAGQATGDRHAPYWQERDLSPRLPAVRAAVLDTTGYLDVGHQFQADTIWGSLDRRTPKAQYKGWWTHEWPDPANSRFTKLDLPSGTVTWESVVVRWLDYWLKGTGQKPAERVYHQDQENRWHEASSWSPVALGKQVLYLTGGLLTPVAKQGSTSFRSAPPADGSWAEHSQLIAARPPWARRARCARTP